MVSLFCKFHGIWSGHGQQAGLESQVTGHSANIAGMPVTHIGASNEQSIPGIAKSSQPTQAVVVDVDVVVVLVVEVVVVDVVVLVVEVVVVDVVVLAL